jgi:putative transposase
MNSDSGCKKSSIVVHPRRGAPRADCNVERYVEKITIGELSDIREDENGDPRNCGQSGSKTLYGLGFDRFACLPRYNPEEHCILVDCVDGEDTNKTSLCRGQIRDSSRVERGLHAYSSCVRRVNADLIGEYPQTGNSQSPTVAT